MRTHLGASSELVKADQLPDGWTNNCRLLHCEGYCLYKLDLTRGAMQAAKQSGAEVYLMATPLTPLQDIGSCMKQSVCAVKVIWRWCVSCLCLQKISGLF